MVLYGIGFKELGLGDEDGGACGASRWSGVDEGDLENKKVE